MNLDTKQNFIYSRGTVIFILLTFFPAPYILQFDYVYFAFSLLRIVAAFLIILYVIINRISFSKITVLIILFYLSIILSTYLTNLNMFSIIVESIFAILFSLFAENSLKSKKERLIFFNSLIFIVELLTYSSFIVLLLFPNGLFIEGSFASNHFLLGNRNATVRILLPGVSFSFILSHIRFKSISLRTHILAITVYAILILMNAVTGIIAYSIIYIYLVFFYKIRLYRFLNIRTFFLIYLSLFILIVIFREQDIFSFLVFDVFNRDLSLSGRIYVWDRALTYIARSPFFGQGYESPDIVYNKLYASSAHNYILDLLYRGGIIHLLIHFEMIRIAMKKIAKFNDNKVSQIVSFTFFAYFLMWLTEPFVSSGFIMIYLLLIVSYRLEVFSDRKHDVNRFNSPNSSMQGKGSALNDCSFSNYPTL